MDSPADPISAHNHGGTARSSSHDQKHQHAMDNFKELLMTCVIESTPSKSLTRAQKTLVNQGIQEMISRFKTPDHPPYAWMIQNAIKLLNEEGGSGQEAISKFIAKECSDLPLGHSTLLEHHLEKLCESGELGENHGKYYFLGGGRTADNPITSNSPSFNLRASPSPSPSSISSPMHIPSPSPSYSLSTSISYSTGSGYTSSSTSSSNTSFNLKKKRSTQRERGVKRINLLPRCRMVKDHAGGSNQGCRQRRVKAKSHGRGRGQGRGRWRGQGRGRGQHQFSVESLTKEEEFEVIQHQRVPQDDRTTEEDIRMDVDNMEATEMEDATIEITMSEEHVQPGQQNQLQGNPDVKCQAEHGNVVHEIESLEQENNGKKIEPMLQEIVNNQSTMFHTKEMSLVQPQVRDPQVDGNMSEK